MSNGKAYRPQRLFHYFFGIFRLHFMSRTRCVITFMSVSKKHLVHINEYEFELYRYSAPPPLRTMCVYN